jgi:hypothetical protein
MGAVLGGCMPAISADAGESQVQGQPGLQGRIPNVKTAMFSEKPQASGLIQGEQAHHIHQYLAYKYLTSLL